MLIISSSSVGSYRNSDADIFRLRSGQNKILHEKRQPYDMQSQQLSLDELKKHVRAREQIIDLTKNIQFDFDPQAGEMDPAYWRRSPDIDSTGTHWIPQVPAPDALRNLFENPSYFDYKIGCKDAALFILMYGAWKGAGWTDIVTDNGAAEDDWIPGEAGWIENNYHSGTGGLEGENIVYVGYIRNKGYVFWGHWPGGGRYKTLEEWYREVKSWNYKWWHIFPEATIHEHRLRPKINAADTGS